MFTFKLQSILSLKEKVEDIKKKELGAALNQQEELQGTIKKLETSLQDLKHSKRNISESGIDFKMIQACNQYETLLHIKRKEVCNQMSNAHRNIETKRKELQEAVKEKKVLDNLRQIKLDQYQLLELGKAQKLVDELVSFKYSNREVIG